MMNIALIGASGFVGKAVLNEALNRGHQVAALVRRPERLDGELDRDGLKVIRVDVHEVATLAGLLQGHDMVISAYSSGWNNPNMYDEYLSGSRAIQEAVKQSGVSRFLVMGGAGSLYIEPGKQIVDASTFPPEIRAGASAGRDYLNILCEEKSLDWAYLSPAMEMHPGTSGERKGTYRLGLDSPVFDEDNRSVLSVEDLAVVAVDEAENARHIRRRFTAAY